MAIAPDSSLVLIELKRDKTPRDIVARAIDYASWIEQLTSERIASIFHRFSGGGDLSEAFHEKFNTELDEDALNQTHQIILVASELDFSTERIVNYLNARDIPINVIFFQVFEIGDKKLLSRSWLIDPSETQVNASVSHGKVGKKEPWNGEYYVSYGNRSWADARKYGFISGGGGTWYSQTLKLHSPGARVWVNIPKKGYVGVGKVLDSVKSTNEFTVNIKGVEKPCLEVLADAEQYKKRAADAEKAEYFVKVEWIETVPETKALNEVGLFGNQNTVCQPTTPKWSHTINRLKEHFNKWDSK